MTPSDSADTSLLSSDLWTVFHNNGAAMWSRHFRTSLQLYKPEASDFEPPKEGREEEEEEMPGTGPVAFNCDVMG